MRSKQEATTRSLHELATLYGIELSYRNMLDGRRRSASPEVLTSLLGALGAPISSEKDVSGALRERRQQMCGRGAEPVVVAWDGGSARMTVRLPASPARRPFRCSLALENGEELAWQIKPERSPRVASARKMKVEGKRGWTVEMRLPGKLPLGYHCLSVESGTGVAKVLVISAPRTAYVNAGRAKEKSWGIFIPVYALQSDANWGVGDLGDLNRAREWVRGQGGALVGTLPLLASFLEEPFDPSPYSPVSRMFWNELFLDMGDIPELSRCPAAQRLVASSAFQAEREALRSRRLVDYRRAMALKRQVLELLAQSIYQDSTSRPAEFFQYVKSHPDLEDYARFRATCDRRQASWWTWPQRSRDGKLSARDYDMEAMRYHLYVQWLAEEQMRSFAKGGYEDGDDLYLDLPLGVSSDGYDVWRYRSSFVLDASAGSPPDDFFTKGQGWGFPPMHPERIREDGYNYFRKALHHHVTHTHVLRIDHVMSLHRLFWVPKGFEPRDGAYVHYHSNEMYAILALESARNQALIVGEDLGTVPGYVRPAMARHRVQRMYVLQFEAAPQKKKALPTPPVDSLATLNTHDMPPFAAFWDGLDIQDRVELGLLDEAGAINELNNRSRLRSALLRFLCEGEGSSLVDVLKASIKHLGSSRSRMVMVNLEDLWFEKQPQNVPGTCEERPNWKRKARYNLDEITRMEQVAEVLRMLDAARRGKEAQ
ncbi:MAG TPA: 4-alpha-glucanotransferase [Terriglobia bacterium]|nr:4-alpha-glucanotransferase [Terriglobia bacterium]